MNKVKILSFILIPVLIILGLIFKNQCSGKSQEIITYIVDPSSHKIKMFWKNSEGSILNNFYNLKMYVEKQNMQLKFATNGGYFDKSFKPSGLYIEDGVVYNKIYNKKINTGGSNFDLNPRGVFYIKKSGEAGIINDEEYSKLKDIKFATQSGPMLIINKETNKIFSQNSKNINIRSGVGVLPNNKIVFAISKHCISFYDFAKQFKKMGCLNAMYLDGVVSKIYLPEKGYSSTDGSFGVMLAVIDTLIK